MTPALKTCSDESSFSVRQCPQTTTFEERFYLAARYLTARPVRFQTKWSEKSGAGPWVGIHLHGSMTGNTTAAAATTTATGLQEIAYLPSSSCSMF